MKVYIPIIAALTAFGASATTPLWLRDVKISPDGTQVAFTYQGEIIYKVSADGGTAVRLDHSSVHRVGTGMVARWQPYRFCKRP